MHRGSAPIGGREPGEGEPRFVPEEDHVGLDRQHLLHHALDVVDEAIEGAVREQEHRDPIELARALELEEA